MSLHRDDVIILRFRLPLRHVVWSRDVAGSDVLTRLSDVVRVRLLSAIFATEAKVRSQTVGVLELISALRTKIPLTYLHTQTRRTCYAELLHLSKSAESCAKSTVNDCGNNDQSESNAQN